MKSKVKVQKEIFKTLPNYNGVYEVSNLGNIRSIDRKSFDGRNIKGRKLKTCLHSNGYLIVGLSNNGISKTRKVHQLVAETFLNHKRCGSKLVVNHINFNKKDNCVENLEIVTQRENANMKHIKSSSKYTGVNWDEDRGKYRALIYINGKSKYLGRFVNEYDAHLAYQSALSKL